MTGGAAQQHVIAAYAAQSNSKSPPMHSGLQHELQCLVQHVLNLQWHVTLLTKLASVDSIQETVCTGTQRVCSRRLLPVYGCTMVPAEDPEEPCAMFQGFLVKPSNQTSSYAISPVASLAMSTAPAACSLCSKAGLSLPFVPLVGRACSWLCLMLPAEAQLTAPDASCKSPSGYA